MPCTRPIPSGPTPGYVASGGKLTKSGPFSCEREAAWLSLATKSVPENDDHQAEPPIQPCRVVGALRMPLGRERPGHW